MGACHLLRCRCVGQLKTFDASSWTRGPNFALNLYLHPYFVYISSKGLCESAQACLGFRWSKVQHVPQNTCAGSNIAWTTRDICVQFSFIESRRLCTGAPDHWARTPDIENCAYSIKYLNNFQNALPTDFKLLHIKAMVFSVLSKVSINFKI